MDDVDIPQIPNCAFHPDRDSVDRCSRCDAWVCSDCIIIYEGMDLCPRCMVPHRGALAEQLKEAGDALELWQGRLAKLSTADRLQPPARVDEIEERITHYELRMRTLQETLEKIKG